MRIGDIIILLFVFLIFVFYITYKHRQKKRKEIFFDKFKGKIVTIYEELEQQGYKLVKYNCSSDLVLDIDGKEYTHVLQIPFIVRRKKKKFLVYIKKGNDLARLSTKSTREFLIILCSIFNIYNVLIIDPDKRKVRTVTIKRNN